MSGESVLAIERDRIDLRVEPELRACLEIGARKTGLGGNVSAFLRLAAIEKLQALGVEYPPPEEEEEVRKPKRK